MDTPEPRLFRRLQRTLLAFFLLAVLFLLWYSLCRVGSSLIAVGIAAWMLQTYRYHGVWAMGRKAPFDAHARDDAVCNPKEATRRITRRRKCP